MTKKKATAKSKAKPKTNETEAATFGSTPPTVLKKLLKAAKRTKTETRAIAGEFGQMVANAVEHDHLHRKAFSYCQTTRSDDRREAGRMHDASRILPRCFRHQRARREGRPSGPRRRARRRNRRRTTCHRQCGSAPAASRGIITLAAMAGPVLCRPRFDSL